MSNKIEMSRSLNNILLQKNSGTFCNKFNMLHKQREVLKIYVINLVS